MKKYRSLRTRIASTIILVLTVATLLIIITIRIISQYQIENSRYNSIYASHRVVDDGLDMVFNRAIRLSSGMFGNSDFLSILQNNDLTITQKEKEYDKMMKGAGVDNETFQAVVVYYENHYYRYMDSSLELENPTRPFINQVFATDELFEQGPIIEDVNGQKYLLIGHPVTDVISGNQTILAVIVFYIKEEVIKDFCNNISPNMGYSLILADDHFLIYHPLNNQTGMVIFDKNIFAVDANEKMTRREIDNQESIIILTSLSKIKQYGFDWKIVSVLSYNELFKDIITLNTYIAILIVIVIIIVGVTAFQVSNGLSKPLNKLIKDLRAFSISGKKKMNITCVSNDEIGELEQTYDEMITRITNLIEANIQEMENKRKLELYALQMQINPHFLYNTLDAIAWMAKIKKETEIEKLVLALAKFFRISLHKGDKFITVEEEIEMIRNFIDIELIRFPDKFDIEYNVADEVKKCETLKLILQPIVENAIKHGISQLDDKGHIIINAYLDSKAIVYEVIDDGMGFTPTDELLTNNKKQELGGYGLKNVDQRIKLEYGIDYGLKVFSKPKGGTKVIITIEKR